MVGVTTYLLDPDQIGHLFAINSQQVDLQLLCHLQMDEELDLQAMDIGSYHQ